MAQEREGKPTSRQIMVDFGNQGGNPFDSVITKAAPIVEPAATTKEEEPKVEPVASDEPLEEPTEPSEPESGTLEEPEEGAEEPTDPPVDGSSTDDNDPEPDTDDDDGEGEEPEVNPYFYLANQLRTDGFLEEEIDINEEIGGIAVYNAYKDKLKKDAEPQIRNEINQRLQNEGYTAQDLMYARAIRQGVDIRLLSEASMYDKYANLPDDSNDGVKQDAIVQMYRARQFKEDEINNQISIAKNNETIDSLFEESRAFFGSKYSEWESAEQKRAEERDRVNTENETMVNNLIKTSLSNRKIMNEEFSEAQAKELEEAIYSPTELFDYQGQKIRITPLQKFLYEWDTNPEMKLYLFKKFLFKDLETENITKKVKKEVEEEFLKGYEKSVTKNTKASKKKAVKTKLEQTNTNKKQYFVGFDNK